IVVRCLEAAVFFALLLTAGAIVLPYVLVRAPRLASAVGAVPLVGALLLKLRPANRALLLGVSIFLSFFTQGLTLLAIFTLTRGISPDATAIVGVLPLIILATHVPLVPGGVGQREAAFVYFYGLVGTDAAVAVGTSVMVFAIYVSFALLGGVC